MNEPTIAPMASPHETPEADHAAATAPARPPVVLQVLPSLVTGGVERGTVEVAGALVQAGWRALVASAGGPMVREVERAGATHITLPLDSKNPLTIRANVKRLVAVIEQYGVDIVHARSRAPAWSALEAARLTGRHFVTTFHGTYNFTNRWKKRYNSVMAEGERVIAISNFIAAHMQEHYAVDPAKIRIIHRGVDLALFDPARVSPERLIQLAEAWRLKEAVPVVMLPGRLTRWKGQMVLLDALRELRHRDLRCLFLGGDQGRTRYRREVEGVVQRYGLTNCVHIVGDCRDMPAAYLLADVVVSASTDPEAFGRVVAEAQAMGRPVIASDHGGARETVIPGETGWLVPPSDPVALAEAIEKVLDLDATAREALLKRCQAHIARHFSKDRMCSKTLDVYEEVLTAGLRPVPEPE